MYVVVGVEMIVVVIVVSGSESILQELPEDLHPELGGTDRRAVSCLSFPEMPRYHLVRQVHLVHSRIQDLTAAVTMRPISPWLEGHPSGQRTADSGQPLALSTEATPALRASCFVHCIVRKNGM